jgi:hypothetical protein
MRRRHVSDEAVLADRNVSNKLLAVESVRIRLGHTRTVAPAATEAETRPPARAVDTSRWRGESSGGNVRAQRWGRPFGRRECASLDARVRASPEARRMSRQWSAANGRRLSAAVRRRAQPVAPIFVAGRATRIAQQTVPAPRLTSASPIRCAITVVDRCRAATPSAVTSIPSAAPASAGRHTFTDRPVG